MQPTLAVERLGHVNVFDESYGDSLRGQREILGAQVFREWTEPQFGGANALALVGGTCIETFAPTAPDGAIGQWLKARGSGWHSLEWTIPSLAEGEQILSERGIRVTERTDAYLFSHPKDLHGLCLELTEHHFEGDDRDVAGWAPTFWSEEHPLGIIGKATIKLASKTPAESAADVAALVGQGTYHLERSHLNTVSTGVEFPDHAVEFVGSATDAGTDLIGTFIAAHGERVFGVSFVVKDLSAARGYLAKSGVRFDQFGRHSLMFWLGTPLGARVELTDLAIGD
ncbi:MAG: hypothetical protein JWO63_496 [Frankiales bacterium]|nr:hypothetical protein [Frankiales bacterium]